MVSPLPLNALRTGLASLRLIAADTLGYRLIEEIGHRNNTPMQHPVTARTAPILIGLLPSLEPCMHIVEDAIGRRLVFAEVTHEC
jgi:hypothetical protein